MQLARGWEKIYISRGRGKSYNWRLSKGSALRKVRGIDEEGALSSGWHVQASQGEPEGLLQQQAPSKWQGSSAHVAERARSPRLPPCLCPHRCTSDLIPLSLWKCPRLCQKWFLVPFSFGMLSSPLAPKLLGLWKITSFNETELNSKAFLISSPHCINLADFAFFKSCPASCRCKIATI